MVLINLAPKAFEYRQEWIRDILHLFVGSFGLRHTVNSNKEMKVNIDGWCLSLMMGFIDHVLGSRMEEAAVKKT